MLKPLQTLFILAALLVVSACTPLRPGPGHTAIASAHPLATEAGFAIIGKGGNAFDAAVAVSAALAVVEPAGSGLGGGGFWLLHRQADGYQVMLDGREKAPLAAHRDMYLDAEGNFIPDRSKDGALAAGIPGTPAALALLAEKYGRLPLSESLQPAIRYARQGFAIDERHRRLLRFRRQVLAADPVAVDIFLENGAVPQQGAILKQPELAETLKKLAAAGREGFYAGETAARLVSGVQAAGGIWTLDDLARYRVVERRPVQGDYRGIHISSAALPSSGGIVLLEALQILSGYDLSSLDTVTRKHLIVEALRRAYHDRALYLGDSDFIKVPVERLLDADYAAGLRSAIRLDRSLPSTYLSEDLPDDPEGRHTTHFSIIDSEGNRVAATMSINFPFGSAFVAPGTGVLLNDEMDDFASRAGALNGYGLTGGAANAIAPGKRMLSSMSPTFLDDGERVAVLGTPGGSRIISMLLLAVLDYAAGHGPESWVSVPRFHHQYIPDVIQYEPGGLTAEEIEQLGKLGHQFKEVSYRYGNMQAVQWDRQTGRLDAASDPRGLGRAEVR